MDKLRAEVKRVTFRDPESGYSVIKVIPKQQDLRSGNSSTLAIVGILPGLEQGDQIELIGKWGSHKKFGKQFEVNSYQILLPTSTKGLELYLASHIKGIGPATAKKIVDKFGQSTSQIIETQPERLITITGITKVKAEEIVSAWKKDVAVREQLMQFATLGISPKLSLKIINYYGDNAYKTIKTNPYKLAEDIWGVGFSKADVIALEIGFKSDSFHRLAAGLQYALLKSLDQGHLYLPHDELIEHVVELTNIAETKIEKVLRSLVKDNILVDDDKAIYLKLYFHTEERIAKLLKEHLKQGTSDKHLPKSLSKIISSIEIQQKYKLNKDQQNALTTTLTNPISILTGGPGTGKSTTLNALRLILEKQNKKIIMAAPTGRAAKRITEITGFPAKTIHRALKIDKNGKAFYNHDNPLPADFLILDEASMIDIMIAYRVVAALGKNTHILFVGDSSQLPSVQAGNVLADLISSRAIPVIHLTEIFRQAQTSAIVRNAHKINNGSFPEFPHDPTDFYFFRCEEAEPAANLITNLVSERIPKKFKVDPMQDIQVLAPMHKTACGVSVLNEKLQLALNPHTPQTAEIKYGQQTYRVGDRVMQTANNYDKEVFNGEIGSIISIMNIDGEKTMSIKYEDHIVPYTIDQLHQIILAYAISIHKSQGSEYPVVVIPILTAHYIMLARNLIYTAITRAKQLVILVGSKKALGIAIGNDKPTQRYTKLAQRLQQT